MSVCPNHDQNWYVAFESKFGIAPTHHYPDGYAEGCEGCAVAEALDRTARHRLADAWDEGHEAACDLSGPLCRQVGHLGANPYRSRPEGDR